MTDCPDTVKVFEDHIVPGACRVEKANEAGDYVAFAIFAGPNARQHAIAYAWQISGAFDEITLEPDAAKKFPGP